MFLAEKESQLFCAGDYCNVALNDFLNSKFWKNCPYCTKKVSPAAVICSTCGGNLGIGSKLAIKQALVIDSTLVSNDSDDLRKLKILVTTIDDAMNAKWVEIIRVEEAKRIDYLAREEVKRIDDLAREEVKRIDYLARLEMIQKSNKEERERYLNSLSPFRRFLVLHRVDILIPLVFLLVFGLVIGLSISNN